MYILTIEINKNPTRKLDPDGWEIFWQSNPVPITEIVEVLPILTKPSMFGTDFFKFSITKS